MNEQTPLLGKLYGIGVGPGDPELMTLKAVKTINMCDVIALPSKDKETCSAYQIAKNVCDFRDKEFLLLDMPMSKDKEMLKKIHDENAAMLAKPLKQGKTVGFLTIGDPCIYSTYLYMHKRIDALGFATEIISGIPSFCAAAAALNIGLAENKTPLLILPSSYDLGDSLENPGTKVLMKSGRQLPDVKKKLGETGCDVYMVENCGLENEKKYRSLSELPENAGYFSLIIAKDSK
jgi:precorrin-2/cobalt-factor-2 C20-methyltransferase